MPSDHLQRLRSLRGRADSLLKRVVTDLDPFVRKEDGTFLRIPGGVKILGDVNVTTTCSCLMSLAITDEFEEFYKRNRITATPKDILDALITAPWMSSGLTANNAFTTSIVLRMLGTLNNAGIRDIVELAKAKYSGLSKEWVNVRPDRALEFGQKLKDHSDRATEFLWLSMSDKARKSIEKPELEKELQSIIETELRRILQNSWFFDDQRFTKASAGTKARVQREKGKPRGNSITILNQMLLHDQFPDNFAPPKKLSLAQIAWTLTEDIRNFGVNDYPASPAIVYWFVDGVTKAELEIPNDHWGRLCEWATQQFNHQRSLVVANHEAVMDPIAMGMAACLCARLRRMEKNPAGNSTKGHTSKLPSAVELESSIRDLIRKQTESGIWPKYFPMFQYLDGAGSNFCFTFELLEAVLHEFCSADARLLTDHGFLEGLEKAVTWCERNRQQCTEDETEFEGWNSGGYVKTLEKGHPESWATAVVRMFLWELKSALSRKIQEGILKKYEVRNLRSKPRPQPDTFAALNNLLDIDVLLKEGQPQSLRRLIIDKIVKKCQGLDESDLRRSKLKGAVSALLFGPPGTSKTEIATAIAKDLGWPLLELTPSDFVRETLANIYEKTEEIFTDLLDLSGVVVFFDEMDALVQTREGESHLDIASQFLTTTMLPKIKRLHDQGRVVFLMATNYQDKFDAAIKRRGRFDLLLCMGPPTLKEKLERLHRAYGLDEANRETQKAGALIRKILKHEPSLQDRLALFTFDEYQSFLKSIGNAENIGLNIEQRGAKEFKDKLENESKFVSLRVDDLAGFRKAKKWKRQRKWKRISELDKVPFKLRDLGKKIEVNAAIRYFCDRHESKDQS